MNCVATNIGQQRTRGWKSIVSFPAKDEEQRCPPYFFSRRRVRVSCERTLTTSYSLTCVNYASFVALKHTEDFSIPAVSLFSYFLAAEGRR